MSELRRITKEAGRTPRSPPGACLRALVITLVLAAGSGTTHASIFSFHARTWDDVASTLHREVAGLSLEELEQREVELERALAEDPHDSDAYDLLLLVTERRFWERDREEREAREVCGRAPTLSHATYEAREATIRAARMAIIRRWLANAPDDPRPYLAALRLAPPDEERQRLVEEAVAHAPDDIRGTWAGAEGLAHSHQAERGAALLESFLEHHPDDPQAYEALVEYESTKDRDAARRWLAAWRARFPDDPVALRNVIELESDRLSEREVERLAIAAADRHPHLLELPELCSHIRGSGRLDAAEACARAVLRRADREDDRRTATAARLELAQTLMVSGRENQLDGELARLRGDPAGVKSLVQLAGATVHGGYDVRIWGTSRAGTEECRQALRLVRGLEWPDVGNLFARQTLAGVLVLCGQTARARPLLDSLMSEERLGQLIDLTGILANLPDTQEYEAALLARARAEPECATVIYEMLK